MYYGIVSHDQTPDIEWLQIIFERQRYNGYKAHVDKRSICNKAFKKFANYSTFQQAY